MNQTVLFSRRILLLLLSVFFIAACGKKGDIGPQGPAGPQGEKGEQGDQGPQGEQGTANVMYSDWTEIDWSMADSDYDKLMFTSEPEVTEDFLDNGGMVLGFNKEKDENIITVYNLPRIVGHSKLSIASTPSADLTDLGLSEDESGVVFFVTSITNDVIEYDFTEDTDGAYVRYILIPGGKNLRQSAPMPDLTDYEAVCEYYGIPK